MKQQPTITYIKNGKENTITLTRWNQRRVLKDVVEMSYRDRMNTQIVYNINADVELIHCKDVRFPEVWKIESSKETICILENCTFERNYGYMNSLKVEGGSFEFINPNLINIEEINTSYTNVQDLSIIPLEKKIKEIKVGIYSFNPCGDLYIKDNANTEKIDAYANKISLNGNCSLMDCDLKGKQIKIGNKQEPTTMKANAFEPKIKATEILELTNCIIDCSREDFGEIYIAAPILKVENATLKAGELIEINRSRFKKKSNESEIVITGKELMQADLISILKEYRNLLQDQIETQKERLLEESHRDQKEKVVNLELELEEHQKKLTSLKEQLATMQEQRGRAITKILSKKPIKTLTSEENYD